MNLGHTAVTWRKEFQTLGEGWQYGFVQKNQLPLGILKLDQKILPARLVRNQGNWE